MASNFDKQLNIAKQLNDLTRQRMQDEKFLDSTLDSRVEILNSIVQNKKDINKLTDIEKDIEDKIAEHIETGHTALADKYKVELKLIKIKKQELQAQENVNDALKKAGDSLLGGMVTKAKEVTEQLKKPGGVLVVGLAAAAALLLSFSKTTDKIGEKFGAIGVTDFAQDLREANVTAAGLGRNIDDVAGSLEVLANEFGVSTENSSQLLSDVTDLSVALGVSNEEGARLVGVLKTNVGLTNEQAISLSKQTALLAKQEGLIPNAVMKDVAASSETIAKFTKDGGKNIAMAAIQARKLGVQLDTAAKMAEGLLDFESSITKEMEASILIGRKLNFDKARSLALSGNIMGATQSIIKQLGSEAQFNKLNVIQRQALADSLNISVGELSKFVRLQGKSKSEMAALTDMDVSELVSEDAISNITLLNNTLKKIGAQLQSIIGSFIEFMGITSESNIGVDLLKIGLIGLGGAMIFIGVSALASSLKIKLMSKILGKSGEGLAKFAATGSAAIPLLLTIAVVGATLAAVFAGIGFAFGQVSEGLSKLLQNISMGGVAQITLLSLALVGLAAGLMAIGVAGLFALPTLLALNMFGMLPGGETTEGISEVHDSILEEKVNNLREEITNLREDMKTYFGMGGLAYGEFGKSTQTALENAS